MVKNQNLSDHPSVIKRVRTTTQKRGGAGLEIWDQAGAVDSTIRVTLSHTRALRRRQLRPVRFSREILFTSMKEGEPLLVEDLALPVKGERELGVRQGVLRALAEGLPPNRKLRVRCGDSGTFKYFSIQEVLRRWSSARASINVTDLHIRGSGVLKRIDCSPLSDFNLLAGARNEIGEQEMLTMVISSAGMWSDSHTDDPDGSNHCFVGKKLWLVWDTFLGLRHNLDDVSRCGPKTESATFSMNSFLSVPGARWFTIEPGQTLFLPGHLTHKVITLEDYLGVGSFFVMLPDYLRTLLRWTRHTPLWALNAPPAKRLELVDQITKLVTRKMRNLECAGNEERARWGIEHLLEAIDEWVGRRTASAVGDLLLRPVSASLVRTARETPKATKSS